LKHTAAAKHKLVVTIFSAIRHYDEDCPSASLRAQSQIIAQKQISFQAKHQLSI
jgi:hypothetical protein